jgi:CRP/FNR family transcriptional regulator
VDTARKESILASCSLFAAVEGASLRALVEMARLQQAEKGRVLFRQGEEVAGLYVVGTGLVRVYKPGPAGREHVLHLAEPGRTFAEVAVLGGFPAPAWAQALHDSLLLILPRAALRARLRLDHPLCLQLLAGLSGWVRHLTDLLEAVVLRDATGRVAGWLLAQDPDGTASVRLPAARRHLASHLGLTPETLSRVLRRLREDGLVVQDGEVLVLRDREGLADAAEGDRP